MYRRADTDWLARCDFGIGVHWTAQTAPRNGPCLDFASAVERFELNAFLDAVEGSGADYVIFTATHALQLFPCPHAVVDDLCPGRTAARDLLGEIASGLEASGRRLVVYYNHSCNRGEDAAWEQAVGYHDPSKDRLAENLCAIVRVLGECYGDLIHGWWFDSSYSLDPSGPHNSVSTDMGDFVFPWASLTAAAKAGFAGRLVTYNAGVNQTHLYTECQDYWAGELVALDTPPTSQFLANGLQWHGWTCLDDRRWVFRGQELPCGTTLYHDDEILDFVRQCRRCRAPMAFNVLSFQNGSLLDSSVGQLGRIRDALADEA